MLEKVCRSVKLSKMIHTVHTLYSTCTCTNEADFQQEYTIRKGFFRVNRWKTAQRAQEASEFDCCSVLQATGTLKGQNDMKNQRKVAPRAGPQNVLSGTNHVFFLS